MELKSKLLLLWLPVVVWSISLLYSTYLFINLSAMPSMYYAERFAGNGFVMLLLLNILVCSWLFITAAYSLKIRKKLLLRCALLISNMPVVWVYSFILSKSIKY
jgi:hypothetical protein